ncbi:MAG: carboxypeptidase regulatory-like domain-containing protein [Gemmatimonadota bacterium]|nr:carboxypeptidase regulatory-like domain-containing protein [Gemmatimonadota bacterium]MDE2870594.1 carboxypeptidase regulatory-like domain-containing protein [Gemmatimonadota bacterium]
MTISRRLRPIRIFAGRLPAGAALPALFLLSAPHLSLHAQDPDTPTGTVAGLVYDSTANVPLSDARVAVMGTSAMTDSDEEGRFRIEDVPVGEHTVMFFHPRLGTLGVGGGNRTVVVTAGSVTEVHLAIPSRETILGVWCSVEAGTGDTSVGGIVTDAITGVPLPGAKVTAFARRGGLLQWRSRVAEVRSGNSGEFRLCNLDGSLDLSVTAFFGTSGTGHHEITRTGAQTLDIAIRIADPVSITGTVTDYATGAPLRSARVRLLGTGHDMLTDSAGGFAFAEVPPGIQVIRTERLGYASRTDSLTAFSREALGLEIPLATEAIVMEPLVVTGRRDDPVYTTRGTRFSGLTEAQVDSVLPRVADLASLVRASRMPGLSVRSVWVPDAFGQLREGLCIEIQRRRGGGRPNACNMVAVRLNDGPVPDPMFFLRELNPTDVRWYQIITPIEAGFLYGDQGANGVLLLYTQRGGRR